MKTAIVFLVIVAIIFAAFFLLNPEGRVDEEPGLQAYFQERMITLGIEDIGHPIEGFDANLLQMAFPGLIAPDFQDVEAYEGHYEVRDGETAFVRDQEQPISSAERTISDEGYRTLLRNLEDRLLISVMNESDVDALIQSINTAERIETRIDVGGSALGTTVTPHEILEDSRCPIDVECIQAGTVRVRATLESGLGIADQVFELHQPITTEAEEVTLIETAPVREEGVQINPENYIFTFEIKKRDI